jgi:pimeloyl-ACP methyl ester carboxylesterase
VEGRLPLEGCELAWDLEGSGPPVALIQGVGVAGSGWRPQVADLAAGHACLTFDHRGIGRSRPAGTPITVERLAADAWALIEAAGWESAHLVGHSLGGLVAIVAALADPSRVRSLSLLCTFSGGPAAAPPSARLLWWGMRSRLGTRAMRRRGFLGLVLPPGPPEEPIEELAARIGELFGHDLADQPPIVADQLRAMRAADAGPRLGELAGIPTLVVSAEHDPIAPPRAGRGLAAGISGARLVEVAGASHGLPITHAARINALLREHLAAAEGSWGSEAAARFAESPDQDERRSPGTAGVC